MVQALGYNASCVVPRLVVLLDGPRRSCLKPASGKALSSSRDTREAVHLIPGFHGFPVGPSSDVGHMLQDPSRILF